VSRLVPHAETTAANLARVLRLHASQQRATAARRLLEELGVHCDESAALHDLKGFLLSSPRGTEIVVCRDLGDEERLEVYAHLIAHALLGPDTPELALAARPRGAGGNCRGRGGARDSGWPARGGAAAGVLPRPGTGPRPLLARGAARAAPRQPGAVLALA
jgi:8-oxo-dGTP pyrophosphatase MutT (NUDIX family)